MLQYLSLYAIHGSILTKDHLAHEILPVDLCSAVRLQFYIGCRTERLFSLRWVFGLMIRPLDPVPSKLGQQDEWERATAPQNLTEMDDN